MAQLKITWVKSTIGHPKDQIATIEALGLKRLNDSVIQEDSPALRGMIIKVRHLVKVEEAA
ncbi:MAG: 50S ribosomal protein L30 [Dehalococcoidales bacterium]|nr:50S ribosomal protein L30 [Dehalococcoidales bacterium]